MDKSSNVAQDLIRGLIAVLSLGIQENQLEDAEKLLDGIKVLSPGLKGIDEFSSYIAIKRGFVREALQMYVAAPGDDSKWFVMMALCLKLAGDPTWHWHAMESLERHDPSARYAHDLAKILLGEERATNAGGNDHSESDNAVAIADSPAVQFPDTHVNYLSV